MSQVVPELVPRRLEDDFSAADTSHVAYADLGKAQTRRKLLAILESVEFSQELPPPLHLNYFDVSVTEKAISSCEQKDEDSGVMFCNVPALHKLLMGEISGVQGTATAGQRNFLIQVKLVSCRSVKSWWSSLGPKITNSPEYQPNFRRVTIACVQTSSLC